MTIALTNDGPEHHTGISRKWTGRTRGGLIGNWIFVNLVRCAGIRAAYLLLVPVTFYYLFFAPVARRASDEYRRRLGIEGRTWFARFFGAWRHFYSFGMMLLDRVAIIRGRAGKFRFDFEGEQHLRNALKQGRGLVLVTAHCGNWESAGHLLNRLPAPVSIVALEAEVPHIRNYFSRVFKDRRFNVISLQDPADASLKIMAALAQGKIIAVHGDRAMNPRRQRVPFLGEPAWFPEGPHMIAAASAAPVVHAFAMREGTYRYHFHAYPAEHLSLENVGRSRRHEAVRQCLRLFVRRLEDKVRRYPYQWHNFYDFWDDDPPAQRRPPA